MAILAQEEVGIWNGENNCSRMSNFRRTPEGGCAVIEWPISQQKKILHLKWQKNPGLPRMIN
jgi:hypothetical protein